MIEINKNDELLLHLTVPILIPSLNEYLPLHYNVQNNKWKKKYVLYFNKRKDLIDLKITDRVYMVWTPYVNNRKKQHYDVINYVGCYKSIEDNIKRLGIIQNDDYRFVAQHLMNHPQITEGEHYISLKLYKTIPLEEI